MADCYYHGPSGSGPCSDCERARRLGVPDDEVSSTQETVPMDVKLRIEDAMMKKQKNSGLVPND